MIAHPDRLNDPEHFARMRFLYGTPEPTAPDVEALRRQLAGTPDHICGIIAEAARAPTAERLETLAIRLQAVARLAMQLRAALIGGAG